MPTPTTMQAVSYSRYGSPERMTFGTLPVPEPGDGQVRIRVHAAGLNPFDWHIYRGDPYVARLAFGLRSPGRRVVGGDVAGVVDALGSGVEGLSVGDKVYGSIGQGGLGEFAVASVGALALMPTTSTFHQAAALPMVTLTAMQGLRAAGVGQGSRVLVIGASGGVGHIAVQMARVLGAQRVVAVCSGRNAAWVADLGADRVIDYTRQSVLAAGETFDVVFDTVSTTPLRRLRRIMAPRGVYVPVGGLGRGVLGLVIPVVTSAVVGALVSQRTIVFNASARGADLDEAARWVEEGALTPVIEAVYPLDQYVGALHHLEGQHTAGKVVVAVTP